MKVFIDGKFCSERDAKVFGVRSRLAGTGTASSRAFGLITGRVFRLKNSSIACSTPPKAILLDIPMSHEKNFQGGRRELSP